MVNSSSVVIPTYNGERFIGRALSSVLSQTMLPNEIIVVDDCSQDATVNVVEGIAAKASVPIRIIRMNRNSGGPAEPLNRGIAAAASPLETLLDQDDCMGPRKLELQVQALNDRPAALAFGIMEKILPNGAAVRNERVIANYSAPDFERLSPGAFVVPAEAVFDNLCRCFNYAFGGASGITLRKDCWERLGGFDPEFRLLWDVDFETRIAAAGLPVIHVPELSHYRNIHGANLSSSGGGLGYIPFAFKLLRKHLQAGSFRDGRETKFVATVVEHLMGVAYRLREAGEHRAAMRLYAGIVREAGFSSGPVVQWLKVPLAAALQALRIRSGEGAGLS